MDKTDHAGEERSIEAGRPVPVLTEQLKMGWVFIILVFAGFMALVTAVLIAWPALAFLGAKLFEP